jgi:hypothetical protein
LGAAEVDGTAAKVVDESTVKRSLQLLTTSRNPLAGLRREEEVTA